MFQLLNTSKFPRSLKSNGELPFDERSIGDKFFSQRHSDDFHGVETEVEDVYACVIVWVIVTSHYIYRLSSTSTCRARVTVLKSTWYVGIKFNPSLLVLKSKWVSVYVGIKLYIQIWVCLLASSLFNERSWCFNIQVHYFNSCLLPRFTAAATHSNVAGEQTHSHNIGCPIYR